VVHAGKEGGCHEEMPMVVNPDGSSQDCVMAASPRAPASNTGDRTICGSFKEPVRGTNLHSAMAPTWLRQTSISERVAHLTKEHPGIVGTSVWDVQDGDMPSASLHDKPIASPLPLPSQDDLPRVGLGRPHGFRNGAEVIHKEMSRSSSRLLSETLNLITPEPVPFVEIVFEAEGKEKRFQFLSKHLGAEFIKRTTGPTKVSKVHVGSYASKLGVEVGWTVKSVDGEDMRNKTLQQTQDAIHYGNNLVYF